MFTVLSRVEALEGGGSTDRSFGIEVDGGVEYRTVELSFVIDDDTADNDGVDEDCKVETWLDGAVRKNKKDKKYYQKYWGAGLCLKHYDTD